MKIDIYLVSYASLMFVTFELQNSLRNGKLEINANIYLLYSLVSENCWAVWKFCFEGFIESERSEVCGDGCTRAASLGNVTIRSLWHPRPAAWPSLHGAYSTTIDQLYSLYIAYGYYL